MTRKLQCGWETGHITQIGSGAYMGNLVTAPPVVASTSPVARSGTYYLKASWNNANANDGDTKCIQRIAHIPETDIWYAFGLYVDLPGTEDPSCVASVFTIYDPAGRVNVAVRWDTGVLRVYRATVATSAPNATQLTLLGSAVITIPLVTWTLVEIHYVGAIGGTGIFQIYVNGIEALNLINVQTALSSAQAGEFDLGYYRMGGTGNAGLGTITVCFDDLRVNNTAGTDNNGRPYDGKIIGLLPNGTGTYTQLTPSVGANWECVNEVPPNTGDLVSGGTVGFRDTYNVVDPTSISNVQALELIAYAQNTDGGGGSVGLTVRSNSIDSEGSPQPITASWAFYKRLMERDPTDNIPWTTARIATMEIGVTVR